MASWVTESWISSTVRIVNDWGETGTGFLVQRAVGTDTAKGFLVTCKHVLNPDPNLRREATYIDVGVNFREPDGTLTAKQVRLPLLFANGDFAWREHPDPDVDVLAVNVTSMIRNIPNLEKKLMGYQWFAGPELRTEHDITIGEDVLVVGYPTGLTQGPTNHPLVRAGIIASQIGVLFEDTVSQGAIERRRTLRAFLVDGATVPGASGSPVILKPVSGRLVKGNIVLDLPPPLLLGIIAETKYAPVKANNWELQSFAGLGLAFDADTIKETIELFFPGESGLETHPAVEA